MKKFISTIFLVFAFSANASLIDNDLYTTDTVSNLDWLDITATIGMNAREVNTLLSPTYNYETHELEYSDFMGGRWTYANESQAMDFILRNIGADFGRLEMHSQESINAEHLMNLIGLTQPRDSTAMFVNDNNRYDILQISDLGSLYDGVTYFDMETRYIPISYSSTSPGGSGLGSFLVREHISAVPIPPSIIMFISGALLLFRKRTIS